MRVSLKRALLSAAAVCLLAGSAAAGVRVETVQREPGSDAALDSLVCGYEDALDSTILTPRERDSAVRQIRLMALFHRAYEKARTAPAAESVGDRLDHLADRLNVASGTEAQAPAAELAPAPKPAKKAAKKPGPAKRPRAMVKPPADRRG